MMPKDIAEKIFKETIEEEQFSSQNNIKKKVLITLMI